MRHSKDVLDQYFLEMRWRCVSLAADLDRLERAQGGPATLKSDPRIATFRESLKILAEASSNRAEQVELLFSDKTPPPNPQSAIRNPQ